MVGSLDQGSPQLVLITECTSNPDLMEPPALYLEWQSRRILSRKRGQQGLVSNKPMFDHWVVICVVHKLIDKCIMDSLGLSTVELNKQGLTVLTILMFSSVLRKPTNHAFFKKSALSTPFFALSPPLITVFPPLNCLSSSLASSQLVKENTTTISPSA